MDIKGLEKELDVEIEEAEAEELPNGTLYLKVWYGDPRKTTTKLWAKKVTNIDTTKDNGYAFEGEWIRKGRGYYEVELNEGEVAVCLVENGSWRHPGQDCRIYFVRGGKMYRIVMPYNNKSDRVKAIHAAAKILELLKGEDPKKQQAVTHIRKAIELIGIDEVRRILDEL